ncbi:MAG TPA: Bax inhibitor-1/YccA family protein [Flavobacteriales bacterium]|nr:Bax inhibitor-1/YccA family protein [Flavobacteriales bacterium]HIO68492.1 Bax inhibitor-1/YccA family protein [Flavobacteriales bacterium]
MRTANPALNKKTFEALPRTNDEVMTINGTVNKTAISLVILLVGALYTWKIFTETMSVEAIYPWLIGGFIGGFIVALITIFKKTLAPITTPIYALLEGVALGGLSAWFESIYPGIVVQAVTLTFGVLFALLFAYRSGLIKVTKNFRLGVVAATGGIALVYLISWLMNMFTGAGIGMIHESGIMGIGFSLFVVVIAALNLVLDFDFIETGAEQGAPKYMEWYGAFGLIVTLVWLYIEILRLLSKLRSR